MKTLIIKDLVVTEELDRKAMAAVHGGTSKTMTSYSGPLSGDMYGEGSKSAFNFKAEQLLNQCQDTLVNNGNNVAFASGITATVTPHQTGTNSINFGY